MPYMFGSCSGVLTGMAAFFIPFRLEKVNIHFFSHGKSENSACNTYHFQCQGISSLRG